MHPLRHEGAQRYVPKGNHFFEVEVQIQRKIRHRKLVSENIATLPLFRLPSEGELQCFPLFPTHIRTYSLVAAS
jgi:hypothetical protein